MFFCPGNSSYYFQISRAMENKLLWRSDIDDWEQGSVDSYKFVIEQAKERLNDIIQESETITKRGMTILLSYIVALSGLMGYINSDKFRIHSDLLTIIIITILAILSIYVFGLLFRLISSKGVFYKGSPPIEIFYREVFEGLSDESGFKSILYNEVERIQNKIDWMKKLNDERLVLYGTTLKFSLFFVAVAIFTMAKTIYSQS